MEPAFAITSIRIVDPSGVLSQEQLLEIDGADNSIDATIASNNSVRVDTSFQNWRFVFDNVGDGPLLEGVYEEATRYPFQSAARPGLSATGNGSGCNTLSGRFAVLEVEYGTGGEVVRFAADLSFSCGSSTSTVPFQANIRINSDLPLTLELPTASAGRDRIVFERDSVALDATQSVGGNSGIAFYQWTQTDGPTVNLSSASSVEASIETPTVVGPPMLLTFEVEVINDNSLVDTDIVTVEVRDRSQPRSWLSYDSGPDDPIGSGGAAFLTEDDGVFTGQVVVDGNQASIAYDGDDGWNVTMIAPDGQSLTGSTGYLVTDGVSKPDIRISHDGRSCGGNDGSFFVYSITPGPGTNDLGSFSASFDQTCTSSSDSLAGEIRYQVVLPEANAGPNRTAQERAAVVLDPGASIDAEGSIEQFQWNQLTGPPVTLDIAADNTATFTYELGDAELEQSFEFQLLITDELGQVDMDVITISVVQDNQAPVAADDMITLQQGFSINLEPLVNDIDVDGQIDASRLLIVDAPDEGYLVNVAGGFTYVSPLFFTGITTVTYVVYDNDDAESNTATITLEIQPGPVGQTDLATTQSGVPVTFDILANDQPVDAPFDPATISILQGPIGGAITLNGNGSVTYTPSGTFSGQDSFSYDVADDNGLRTPATYIVVTVTAPAGQQPAPPPTPTPSTPPSTPAPAPATSPAQQPEVCSNVSPLSGNTTCGGGSLSPLSFLALGLAFVRIRRLRKLTVVTD